MTTKQCNNCYYHDVCDGSELCDDYYPIGEEAEEADIEELIEKRREEFQEEWNEYISEFNN